MTLPEHQHFPGDGGCAAMGCQGRWDAITSHTRTQGPDGPDYCAECSHALIEWVQWPCPRRVGLEELSSQVAEHARRLAAEEEEREASIPVINANEEFFMIIGGHKVLVQVTQSSFGADGSCTVELTDVASRRARDTFWAPSNPAPSPPNIPRSTPRGSMQMARYAGKAGKTMLGLSAIAGVFDETSKSAMKAEEAAKRLSVVLEEGSRSNHASGAVLDIVMHGDRTPDQLARELGLYDSPRLKKRKDKK